MQSKKIFFSLLMLVISSYVNAKELNNNISDFIELFTRNSEPTAYEYSQFVGGGCGGEPEIDFNYRECKSKNLELNSKECQKIFDKSNCHVQLSNHLKWVREYFKTVGNNYTILNIEQKLSKDKKIMDYEIIEVMIGKNKFTLLHNLFYAPPYSFWISKINDKNVEDLIDEYFKSRNCNNKNWN